MNELDLIGAVAQVGFPIVVASYLLMKGAQLQEKYVVTLEKITDRLEHIEECMKILEKKL